MERIVEGEEEIMKIEVQRDVKRKGVGSMMMDGVMRNIYKESEEKMFMEVEEEKIEEKEIYRRIGLKKVGERKEYYEKENGRYEEIIMRREMKREK